VRSPLSAAHRRGRAERGCARRPGRRGAARPARRPRGASGGLHTHDDPRRPSGPRGHWLAARIGYRHRRPTLHLLREAARRGRRLGRPTTPPRELLGATCRRRPHRPSGRCTPTRTSPAVAARVRRGRRRGSGWCARRCGHSRALRPRARRAAECGRGSRRAPGGDYPSWRGRDLTHRYPAEQASQASWRLLLAAAARPSARPVCFQKATPDTRRQDVKRESRRDAAAAGDAARATHAGVAA
jgi:hypothetical protein